MKLRNFLSAGFLLAVVTAAFSCNKLTGNANNPPELTFSRIKSNSIIYKDTAAWYATFKFKDKDGDIGNDQESNDTAVIMIDARYPSSIRFFPFPYMPAIDFPDTKKEGSFTLYLKPVIYFLPRTDSVHSQGYDTTVLSFVLRDENGHISDTVKTDTLYIHP